MPLIIRSLTRRATLSLMIVALMALAIGANTAIYSVTKAVVLAPLPFRDPDRVVHIFEGSDRDRYQPGHENSFISVRGGTFEDWREQCRSFEAMAAVRMAQTTLGGDRPAVVDSVLAGEGLFETLGTAPDLGRYFNARDYLGSDRTVVLSHRLWRERFDGDRSIVGREILLDGANYRVIGVMPKGFYASRWAEPKLWLPMQWDPATKHSRVLWGLLIYARLKAGVTLNQAQAELDLVASHIRAAHPDDYEHMGAIAAPVAGYTFGHYEHLFWLLLGAVGLVLLIACANVANLLLARSLERRRDFALRIALGASRWRLMKLVVGESLILAGLGGVMGVAICAMLTGPVVALLPPASRIPRLGEVHLDSGVLLFSLAISVLAGVLFGIVPGIRATRGDLCGGLKEGVRGNSLGRGERLVTDGLVAVEVALSLLLLVAGGSLMREFLKLLQDDPGFQPAQALAFQISVPAYRYGPYQVGARNPSRTELYERLERAAAAIPGVEAVGVTASLPLRHPPNPWSISIEGRPNPAPNPSGAAVARRPGLPIHGSVSVQRVTPGYFAALGMPLVRGRLLNDHDRPEAPLAALINQTAARKFFPNEDPIGKRVTADMTSYLPKMTIVGVVGDSRMNGMDREIYPQVFWPMSQLPSAGAWIVVRTKGTAESAAGAIRTAIRKSDPDLAIVESATMTEVLRDSLWQQRFSAVLVGLFAALATLIASAGLFAMISYSVARQTRELGVRVALGASRTRIASLVLGHGLSVTAAGIAVGTLVSFAISRFVALQLPTSEDLLWVLLAVAVLLLLVTLVACALPVRKALAIDPVVALRSE